MTQQHARSLKNSLADPVARFQVMVAKERYLALLSLANPTNTQVASELGLQEARTQGALTTLTAALKAPDVASYASGPEKAAIKNLLSMASISSLSAIRGRVADDAISMPAALAEYDSVINAGYRVIDEALSQQTNVSFVTEGLNVVNLDRASAAAQEERDLLSADLALGKLSNADRIALAQIAGQRQTIIDTTVPELSHPLSAILARYVPPRTSGAMTTAEAAVINASWRRGAPPAQLTAATATFQNYELQLGKSLAAAGTVLQAQANHNANIVVLELVLAAGLGLLGTIASIALSLVIGRGLVRQLRDLRESALTLAHEKLPAVISQLRAGEQVEIADYAPGAVSSSSEIEQVQHAFAIVQQTAVQSAVDEARLRRGISDVFRNLAGRSQSLLHRQLTLLDGMERRATEPEELEDLFRIDHLTTRMRRHAEGLIILSGEAPARGWRQPVPLVDVLRAAVAEVEDYTRIRVLCRTSAAVAGHAVADVIHLVAELAENATVFSPPNTPVRIQGDVVGKGFAVEIEDRGLGISAARLEEINANLASPPQFDLSGSDRLGLFIAGQLAQRHDIKITLRPSVYGGTTAIVLIPTTLVVEEDTFTPDPQLTAGRDDAPAGTLPGRRAALAGSPQAADSESGGPATARPHGYGSGGGRDFGSLGLSGYSDSSSYGELAGYGKLASRADASPAAHGVSSGYGASPGNGFSSGEFSAGTGSGSGASITSAGIAPGVGPGNGVYSSATRPAVSLPPDAGDYPSGPFSWPHGPGDISGASANGRTASSTAGDYRGASYTQARDTNHHDDAGTGQPATADYPATPYTQARDTNHHDDAGTGQPATAAADYPGGSQSRSWSRPDGADIRPPRPDSAVRSHRARADATARDPEQVVLSSTLADEVSAPGNAASATEQGLPRRVRQASLAPQLRAAGSAPASRPGGSGFGSSGFAALASRNAAAPAGRTSLGATASSPEPPEPEEARNTMSALQRGWQLGRSETDTTDAGMSVFTPRWSPAASRQVSEPKSTTAPDNPQAATTDERGE